MPISVTQGIPPHAPSHASAGSDPLAPAAIGAATSAALSTHENDVAVDGGPHGLPALNVGQGWVRESGGLLAVSVARQADLDGHAGLTTGAHGGIVASTDTRLSDQRVPTDGSVSAVKTGLGDAGLGRGSFSIYKNRTHAAGSGGTWDSVFAVDADTTEEWDVSNWYSGGLFTPKLKGIYRFSAGVHITSIADGVRVVLAVYRNGQESKRLADFKAGAAGEVVVHGSAMLTANGSTDYFDLYFYHNHGSTPSYIAGLMYTYFQGELVGRLA